MATEGPMLRDGTKTANSDLSANQFYAVRIISSLKVDLDTTGGVRMFGILQNKPTAGLAADVAIVGISKAVAGAAISAGASLMTDSSSRVITRTGTSAELGIALEAAAVLGQIIQVMVLPTTQT